MKNKAFNNIVGQKIAITRLSESLAAAENGGEMLSPLLIGEAGLGKSALSRAYINGCKAQGMDVLEFESPEEFRSKGASFSSIIQLLQESPKYAIHIGEIHLINHKATVQSDKIKAFLMKALDKGNQNKAIRLDDNLVVDFNRTRGTIVLDTNFPRSIDGSGAFQSRCDTVVLDLYTEQELIDILQVMLQNAGFREANEETLRMIARCGRGTARPLEHIVGQLKTTNQASNKPKSSVNRDDVLNALILSKMYPRGLQPFEINILKRTELAIRDNVLRPSMPQIETKQFNDSKGYLINCGFVAPTTQGTQRTDKGTRYLTEIAKIGFPV